MDNNAIQKDVVAEQDTPGSNKLLSRYVTSHPGQLSLVIPLWVGAMSTSQRAVNALLLGSKGRYGSCVGDR